MFSIVYKSLVRIRYMCRRPVVQDRKQDKLKFNSFVDFYLPSVSIDPLFQMVFIVNICYRFALVIWYINVISLTTLKLY